MFAKQANAPASAVAAVQPASAAAAPAGPKAVATIALKKPIEGQHGSVRQISLRDADFGDYLDCGELYTVAATGAIGSDGKPEALQLTLNAGALMRWIERLSGLNQLELRQLSMPDFRAIEHHVRLIVGNGEGNSPSEPTSSSSSSA